ncbi:2-hydroxychromene-2-carboxylate isomerase [Chenggangzhangella methanolivorans]|uniref:2-hydroxychromene-2-carboxylate isomerase n=1 Tax=Chenggangzhangella methanolivorans TaxID=1437009 RepID=A0A9E6ULQ3_9HYPH|nr:2-hydroxychromene-2-carboxylate isomerase [Chenggangzhangella methanolivorans]QZN98428.1 2-hydroxychromene-2-carboxylate isomerase [Chenggangzhangella methanolivorans]
MPRRVDVYFSVMSPWAHLGNVPFLAVVRRHGLEVAWRPVPLGELFAETGGLPLAKRTIERRRYRDVELSRWSQKRGRPVKLRPAHWPFSPALADRAVIAVAASGEDPADFVVRAGRGVWEEDRDLAARETLAELLLACGHNAERVLARAESEETAAAYQANFAAARAASVFGSPTYVLDGEVFWGQDRIDLLDDALASGRRPYTASE